MITEASRPASLAGTARSVEAWLVRVLDLWSRAQATDGSCDYSPSTIIVGLWLCGQISDGNTGALTRALSARASLLGMLDAQGPTTFLKTPTASCYALAILRGLGCESSGLERFAKRAGEVLARAETAGSAPGYYEVRRILWRLGLAQKPASLSPVQLEGVLEHMTPGASRQETDHLVTAVASATDCGTRPVTTPGNRQRHGFDELLLGIAMYELRQYDLDSGTRLLRTLLYLGLDECTMFNACVEYIYLQQRAEGAFGFFGPVVDADAAIGSVDEALRVLVPTTLSCLLVLAECNQPGWRLARALDGSVPREPSA